MLNGDWKKCRDYIVNDKMNAKVWNLFRNVEKVKEMVVRRIQEESLRTYLLMYSTVYTTVSLDVLGELFELNARKVHSVIRFTACSVLFFSNFWHVKVYSGTFIGTDYIHKQSSTFFYHSWKTQNAAVVKCTVFW
uniref:PCI domain-containing protein n=1 Tax=Parascaris equorum TaxID=6256 RepID=A0A914S8M2_PAREQ